MLLRQKCILSFLKYQEIDRTPKPKNNGSPKLTDLEDNFGESK